MSKRVSENRLNLAGHLALRPKEVAEVRGKIRDNQRKAPLGA